MTESTGSTNNPEPIRREMLTPPTAPGKKRGWIAELVIALSGEHGKMHRKWLAGMVGFVITYARTEWDYQPADAEDVAQETWKRLRKHLPTPQNGINGSIEIKRFVRWVARNVIIDRQRRKRARLKEVPLEEDVVVESKRRWADPASAGRDERVRAFFDKVIALMPPARQATWLMCQMEGLSYPQAAARTGTSIHTVKAHVTAGNKQIREDPEARALLDSIRDPDGTTPSSTQPNDKRNKKEEQ